MATGLEIKRLRGNISAQKVADLIGVSAERLRKWEERDADPKDTGDIMAIESYFGLPLSKLGDLKHFDFVQKNKPTVIEDKKNPDSVKNQEEQNLADLMKSHKALAYAHQKLADAHQIIAETNRNLSKGAPTEGKPEIDGILDFLLKALAKIGTGTRWQSEDEAIAALNREWLGIQRSGSSKDIPQDQHKQDISR